MSRPRIQIAPHLSYAELTQNHEKCENSKVKTYWQTIQLLSQTYPYLSVEQVAKIVGFSTDWVRKLVHRYNRLGPIALTEEHRALRKKHLNLSALNGIF